MPMSIHTQFSLNIQLHLAKAVLYFQEMHFLLDYCASLISET